MGKHQDQAKKFIEKTLLDIKKNYERYNFNYRIIKIHGGQYQESGLPDLMILTNYGNFWVELKSDSKNDIASPLQKYNIENLKQYNFITAFVYSNGTVSSGTSTMAIDVFFEFFIKTNIENAMIFSD